MRYALEGSVLLDGDQVRINARLVDTQLGHEIWGDRFDTARTGVLQVQDEIVGRLSRAIGLEVVSFAAFGAHGPELSAAARTPQGRIAQGGMPD